MVMDDPWGSSPWADELQIPITIKTREDARRPTTPVRVPKLGLEEKVNSPWDDDDINDGFGDWAALPEDEEQRPGFVGAVDGWGKQVADLEESTIFKSEGASHPDSDFISGAATLARQPSPDPWALELQAGQQKLGDLTGEDSQPDYARKSSTAKEFERSEVPVPPTSQLPNGTVETRPDSEKGEKTTVKEDSPDATIHDSDTRKLEEETLERQPRSEHQDVYPVSRPSSSPSEHSHHDELSQESPRTSFDEEPKPNRPQVPRKVSTKVHELVQHFDTLRKSEDGDQSASRSTSADAKIQDSEEEEDSEGEDDFGDFEEGQLDDEEPELEDPQSKPDMRIERPGIGISEDQAPVTSNIALIKDYGVVEYVIDAANLEGMFPSSTPESTPETVFIADSVPSDSFSSTEQRKTWYRISRYGTMRKHNNGNDENYIRVGWKPSMIREDTLKIVSRWIEEDRVSGRVVLGGGSRGSTVFGWNDAITSAVPLSDVFLKHGKKLSNLSSTAEQAPEMPREWPKGLTRESPASKRRSSSSKPRSMGSVKAVSEPAPANDHSSPVTSVAQFGWNSTSAATNSTVHPLPLEKMSLETELDSGPGSETILALSGSMSSHTPILSGAPSSHHVPSQDTARPALAGAQSSLISTQKSFPVQNLSMSTAFNEDDDWGEMVSTPATPTLPVMPPLKSLRHKKSQSFGGMLPSRMQELTLLGVNENDSATNHRSTTSFDGLHRPQALVPTIESHSSTVNVVLSTAPVRSHESHANLQLEHHQPPSDPWASADFSFFGSGPAPSEVPVASGTPKAADPKAVKFNTPSPSVQKNQKSKEELKQDKIVQSVVNGLPDLSYMLRK